MATYHFIYLLILLILCHCISTSSGLEQDSVKTQRKLQNHARILDETITNPANFPPYTQPPAIVTIPGTNPTSPVDPTTTTPPTTTVPTTTTPAPPINNPANPGNTPIVYPVNQPTPTTTAPITQGQGPTPTTNAPITQGQGQGQGQGQSWCIAKSGAPESSLQDALDYACGIGGADCSMIQQGGSCYNPNSLENHASFAFNSYFQKNPSPTSCDFGGSAVLVNTNPSSGSCIYPSSGAAAAVPLTTNPPTTETPSSTFPTPTTPSPMTTGSPPYGVLPAGTYGSPSLSNPNNPNSLFPANYGPDSPPTSTSLPAGSAVLQPRFDLTILVAFFIGKLILDV